MLCFQLLLFHLIWSNTKYQNKKLLNKAEVGDLIVMNQKISKSDLGHGFFFGDNFHKTIDDCSVEHKEYMNKINQ